MRKFRKLLKWTNCTYWLLPCFGIYFLVAFYLDSFHNWNPGLPARITGTTTGKFEASKLIDLQTLQHNINNKRYNSTISLYRKPKRTEPNFPWREPKTEQNNYSFPLINNVNGIDLKTIDYLSYEYERLPYPTAHVLDEQKVLFETERGNVKLEKFWNNENRWIGRLKVIQNGVFKGSFKHPGCGYETSLQEIESSNTDVNNSLSISPIIIPDGWSFQHFIQDTLPKLVQAYDILRHPNTTLVMQQPRDADRDIIVDILQRMKLYDNVKFQGGLMKARYVLNACNTPPLHTSLFQTARKMIGGSKNLQVPRNEAYVVYLSRNVCHNCGRKIMNEKELLKELHRRYGKDKVVLHDPLPTVEKLLQRFSKAKLILGVHGGGIYNMLFATTDTKFVEIMPNPFSMGLGAHCIGYLLGQSFGMDYWKFYGQTVDQNDNVNLNMTLMTKLLDKIDSS